MAEDFGKLVLRLGVGGLLLLHGFHTLLTGLDPVKSLLASHHLSEALAYAVYFGEIVGPLLVLAGLFARFGALLIALEVAAFVALGRSGELLALAGDGSYALETPAALFIGAVVVLLLGPGRLAVAQGKFH